MSWMQIQQSPPINDKLLGSNSMQATIHYWPIRIYYEDTDMAGIVYYANYLKYLERARTEYIRSIGFEQDELIEQESVVFVVRSVQLDYLKPARFNDQLEVATSIEQCKGASLIFKQTIRQIEPNHEIIVEAVVKVACLDASKMCVKAMPKNMLKQLKNDH